MSTSVKLSSLKNKLEEKQALEKQVEKIDEAIDELTTPRKKKIIKNNKK